MSKPQQNHLTPRQMQILKAISNFRISRCYSPTIGELAEQMEISRSTAYEHISELRKKGLLTASPGKARSLSLTAGGQDLLEEPVAVESGLPLLGRVAAGAPIEAIENRDTLELPGQNPDGGSFALQVTGDSMIEEGIFDGDYVICKKVSAARNGQLVIAIVDDDSATLKRFYREADRVRLEPANSAYKPIYSRNCRVQAVVTGLVRNFQA